MPNQHLVLTYYTSIPVQSVSAVRRDWLDGFEGDLVIVDTIGWYHALGPSRFRSWLAAGESS